MFRAHGWAGPEVDPICVTYQKQNYINIFQYHNQITRIKGFFTIFIFTTGFLLGLEKYGKKKAEYGKIFVSPDFCPDFVFFL